MSDYRFLVRFRRKFNHATAHFRVDNAPDVSTALKRLKAHIAKDYDGYDVEVKETEER